jgi:predicted dehydrogenase
MGRAFLNDTEAAMPVPVAVIGCGYWGRNLVRNFAELGALAASAIDQATASQLSARYGAPVWRRSS